MLAFPEKYLDVAIAAAVVAVADLWGRLLAGSPEASAAPRLERVRCRGAVLVAAVAAASEGARLRQDLRCRRRRVCAEAERSVEQEGQRKSGAEMSVDVWVLACCARQREMCWERCCSE